MMDDLGLIHMNGRIYDPLTGRFLSADQVIQSPLNLQSYNRYSYCMNNPLGYTDPSGYYAAAAAIPLIEASAYVVTAATAVYLSSPYLQKAVQTMGESMVSLKDAVVDMFKEPGFSDEQMSALQGLQSEGCQVFILTSGSVLVVFPNTTELDGNKTQTGNIELQSQTPATVQNKPQEVHPTVERTEGEIASTTVETKSAQDQKADKKDEKEAKPSSAGKMQKEVERGQAPKGIERVDKRDEGTQTQPHVHYKDGTASNQDGSTHDEGGGKPNPTKKEIEWIKKHNWTPPPRPPQVQELENE